MKPRKEENQTIIQPPKNEAMKKDNEDRSKTPQPMKPNTNPLNQERKARFAREYG